MAQGAYHERLDPNELNALQEPGRNLPEIYEHIILETAVDRCKVEASAWDS